MLALPIMAAAATVGHETLMFWKSENVYPCQPSLVATARQL
jgi:hypothetical protein